MENAIRLEFRARLPNGEYFYQKSQHLPSFLRRVLQFWGASHPTYLKGNLEDLLEIKLGEDWYQCTF